MPKSLTDLHKALQKQVFAHRGAPRLAPENTAASFKKAAALKAQWVEFDTQLSSCGEWVVIHDETLERTTNGSGHVDKHNLTALKGLDAGSWFDPDFADQRILTLSETLALLAKLQLFPNIEVKSNQALSPKAMNSLLQTINNSPVVEGPLLISSFEFQLLKQIQKQCDLPLGYIVETISKETIKQLEETKCFSLHCNYENLQNNQIPIITQMLPLLLYTVNNPELARKYFDLGVTAIFSDIPNLLDPNFY